MIDRLLAKVRDRDSASGGLLASAFWSLVMRVLGMGLGFLVGVQLARYLGPEGFGVYGIAFGIVSVLAAVAQMGLYLLATSEIAVARSHQDWPLLRGVIRWFALSVVAVGILLGFGLLAFTEGLPASPPLRAAAWWGAPLIALSAWILLAGAELRALDRLMSGQALEIIVRPALMSAFLLWLYLSQGRLGADQAMAINLLASAFTLLLALFWLHRAIPGPARKARPDRHVRKWLAAGIPLAFTEILRQVDGTYGIFVMGIITTTAETGVFRVAASIIAVIGMPMTVLTAITAPTLARLQVDGSKGAVQRLLSLSALAVFVAVLLTIVGLVLAGPRAITLLFGELYWGSWLPLILLSLAQLVNGFFGVGLVFLAVAGGGRSLARAYGFSVATGLFFAFLLGRLWGAEGVALAAVAGAVVNNLLVWRHVQRVYDLDTSLLGLLRRRPKGGSL